jgi:hypothetical protein
MWTERGWFATIAACISSLTADGNLLTRAECGAHDFCAQGVTGFGWELEEAALPDQGCNKRNCTA